MAAQQVLLLTGENLTGIAATLLGYYRLDTAREVDLNPVWRHVAGKDAVIAFDSKGTKKWKVQTESQLGSRISWIHQVSGTQCPGDVARWYCYDGKAWSIEASITCMAAATSAPDDVAPELPQSLARLAGLVEVEDDDSEDEVECDAMETLRAALLTEVASAGEEEGDKTDDEDFVSGASADSEDDDGGQDVGIREEVNYWVPIPEQLAREAGTMTVTHLGPISRYVLHANPIVVWDFSCRHNSADGVLSIETATRCKLTVEGVSHSSEDCGLHVITPQLCATGHTSAHTHILAHWHHGHAH